MLEINHFHNGISRITRNTGRVFVVLFVAFAVMTIGIRPASAQVPVCQALTLYGNAANQRLCKQLSTGNNWVCELASGNPDIHTTFNATNHLHITVRPCAPQERSNLTGAWPGNLRIAPGQPATLCGVSIQNYVDRLNAVAQMPAAPGRTLCQTPFIAAQDAGRIQPNVSTFYQNLCRGPAPNIPACQ